MKQPQTIFLDNQGVIEAELGLVFPVNMNYGNYGNNIYVSPTEVYNPILELTSSVSTSNQNSNAPTIIADPLVVENIVDTQNNTILPINSQTEANSSINEPSSGSTSSTNQLQLNQSSSNLFKKPNYVTYIIPGIILAGVIGYFLIQNKD